MGLLNRIAAGSANRAPRLRLTLEWVSPDRKPNTLYDRTGIVLDGRDWDVATGLIRDLTHEVREFRDQDAYLAELGP